MSVREELHVTGREEWREWLKRNHASKREIWLIYYKQHTGRPRIPYDGAVEEASCFGWVGIIVRKIDDERFAQKFTPRTGKSRLSEPNKKRAVKIVKMGRMTEAGFRRIGEATLIKTKKPLQAKYLFWSYSIPSFIATSTAL